MGFNETNPEFLNHFSAASQLGHNMFVNPYITTGFGGPFEGHMPWKPGEADGVAPHSEYNG